MTWIPTVPAVTRKQQQILAQRLPNVRKILGIAGSSTTPPTVYQNLHGRTTNTQLPHTTNDITRIRGGTAQNTKHLLHPTPRKNDLYGDPILPRPNICRILSQNIQGITDDPLFTDARLIRDEADAHQIDVLCLIETNLNWNRRDIKNRFKAALKDTRHTHYIFSGCSNTSYLPGGTCMIMQPPWSTKATSTGDPSGMGRWSEINIQGKQNRQITIITAYRVCPNTSHTHDDNTCHSQQWRQMFCNNIPNPDPRQATLDALSTRITALHTQGSAIILNIDANEHMYQKRDSKLPSWIQENKLIDVHAKLHGFTNEPETCKRGSHRIDFTLVSPNIIHFIVAAGILPYNTLGKGDHRPLYIDVQAAQYLNDKYDPISQRQQRILTTKNPKAIKLYRENMNEFLTTSHFERDCNRLYKKLALYDGPLPEHLQREYNRLDKWFTTTCLKNEQKCDFIPTTPWSPALNNAKLLSNYWYLWISEITTGIKLGPQRTHNNTKWQRNRDKRYKLALTLQLDNTIPTLSDAHKYYKAARKLFLQIQRDAIKIRHDYLEKRAAEYMEDGDDNRENILTRIRHAEQQQHTTHNLRQLVRPEQRRPLSSILVDNPDGSQRYVSSKDEMNQLIIQRNITHFSQAEGTPFTLPELSALLGKYATTPISQQILDGTYDIDTIPATEATKIILRACQRISPPNSIDDTIHTDEFRKGMKIWRESTTTSPSQLHLGHAKAIQKFEKDVKTSDPKCLSERIFSFQTTLLNNAIQHNFVPTRWNTVHDVMIEKSPGNPYLPKLRTITISEKDENLLSGILFGRRMMYQGELLTAFGDEQGGSRRDRDTSEVSLFKHTMFSISRLTNTELISFDNDAKSCFDRIIMTFASLAAQRLGISTKACELMINILHSRQHHIITQYGPSEHNYHSTTEHPLHGPGQGGKGSAAIWVMISTILMECMEQFNPGANFLDPRQHISVTQRMTGFVDDTTHWMNSFLMQSTTLTHQAATTAQAWEQLLFGSGGKLELTKCFTYHIKWTADKNGFPVMDHSNGHRSITSITDSTTQTLIPITSIPTNKSHKTLGIFESPDGRNKDETTRLMEISTRFKRILSTTTISTQDTTVLYYTYYLPSISYALTVGTQTKAQLHKIQSPVTFSILASLGLNRHTPGEITFGPTALGGKGLRHLFAEQGTIKVQALMRHIRTPRPLGKLLRIKLLWDQRISGQGHPILQAPFYTTIPLQRELWTTTLQEFLKESQLEINIPAHYYPTPRRLFDVVLMDMIYPLYDPKKNKAITPLYIKQINHCRLYLRVETLADITNAQGTHINKEAFHCTPKGQTASMELWPHTPTPNQASINSWKTFLRTFCRTDSTRLHTPITQWITAIAPQKWDTFFNNHTLHALLQHQNSWCLYQLGPATRHGHNILHIIDRFPDHETPDTSGFKIADRITNASNDTYIISSDHFFPAPTIPQTPRHYSSFQCDTEWFQHTISEIPQWEQELLTGTRFLYPVHEIAQIWTSPNTDIYIVSDGGHIEQYGSFGWVIATDSTILIENTGVARGTPMSSYRAEAYGKLSWIIFLKLLTPLLLVRTKCTFHSYLDNLEVVRATQLQSNIQFASSALIPDYDILSAIIQEQRTLTGHLNLTNTQHVKGHQDNTKPYHKLSRPAQLNIRADTLATASLQHIRAQGVPQATTANPHCLIYLQDHQMLITSKEQHLLRWKWPELSLQTYYERIFKLKKGQLHELNWAGYNNARKSFSTAEINFSIKLTTNWLPVGHIAERSGNIITVCHRCQERETLHHLFTCTNNTTSKTLYIDSITQALTQAKTEINIQNTLIHGLHIHLALPTTYNVPISLQHCFHTQTTYGWQLVCAGLLIQQWSQHQQLHQIDTNTPHSPLAGDIWNRKISSALIRQAHQIWITRCSEVHDTSPTYSKAQLETIAQLHRLYQNSELLPYTDRQKIFSDPIDTHIAKGCKHISLWIRRNAKAIKKAPLKTQTR